MWRSLSTISRDYINHKAAELKLSRYFNARFRSVKRRSDQIIPASEPRSATLQDAIERKGAMLKLSRSTGATLQFQRSRLARTIQRSQSHSTTSPCCVTI